MHADDRPAGIQADGTPMLCKLLGNRADCAIRETASVHFGSLAFGGVVPGAGDVESPSG